jgi:hypothetical protein
MTVHLVQTLPNLVHLAATDRIVTIIICNCYEGENCDRRIGCVKRTTPVTERTTSKGGMSSTSSDFSVRLQ